MFEDKANNMWQFVIMEGKNYSKLRMEQPEE